MTTWKPASTPAVGDRIPVAFANAFGVCSTYTPTLTATTTSPTLGSGAVRLGRYFQVQNQAWLSVQIWVARAFLRAGVRAFSNASKRPSTLR